MPTARLTGRTQARSWRKQQRVGPKVIDETVRVAKKFLDENPKEMAKIVFPLSLAEKNAVRKPS